MTRSDTEKTAHSFTMRLTADDQNLLGALCAHYGLNRPDSVRKALREAQPLTHHWTCGLFTPTTAQTMPPFTIRLKRKDTDAR